MSPETGDVRRGTADREASERRVVRVVVVDSGVGNIPNAVRGLQRAGAEVTLTSDPRVVAGAERLVLPGVGAFPVAMARLGALGLDTAVRQAVAAGAPVLGICLGHQLLFEASQEFGDTPGLGLLAGRVTPLPPVARIPHMGWSALRAEPPDLLVEGLHGAFMYFVHSFAVEGGVDTVATVDFGGVQVCAAVRRGSICGVQFHPEKSGTAGARLLSNFLRLPSSRSGRGRNAAPTRPGPRLATAENKVVVVAGGASLPRPQPSPPRDEVVVVAGGASLPRPRVSSSQAAFSATPRRSPAPRSDR